MLGCARGMLLRGCVLCWLLRAGFLCGDSRSSSSDLLLHG
jgi:hypothetical protein